MKGFLLFFALSVAVYFLLRTIALRRYRNRPSSLHLWKERFSELKEPQRFMNAFCEAYILAKEDFFKFGPNDRVSDVYRACTSFGLTDTLECETLYLLLEEVYDVKFKPEFVEKDPTLGNLFEYVNKQWELS